MADTVSKTAKKSRGEIKKQLGKRCPGCGEAMVATKVIAFRVPAGTYEDGQTLVVKPRGGMYWICSKCEHREPVHNK